MYQNRTVRNRRKILERHIKTFLDLLILALLKDQARCGYEILAIIHRRFNILISPGTLYPLLHTLEKQGLIDGESYNRRKNYIMSRKGLEVFRTSSKDFESSSRELIRAISLPPLEEADQALVEA